MSEKSEKDLINPSHYRQGAVECIDAIQAALGPDGFKAYLRGQCLKYLWRYPHKQATHADLSKCQWYLNRLIQAESRPSASRE